MGQIFLKTGLLLAMVLQVYVDMSQQKPPKPQEKPQAVADGLSKEDKAEIIKLALELALVKKQLPDYEYLKKQGYVPLSVENISAELVPKMEGINLLPLDAKEIRERADSRGDYVYYLRFEKFRVKGNKVTVSLDNYPMYAKSATVMAFGGSLHIEFQKMDGEWTAEVKARSIV